MNVMAIWNEFKTALLPWVLAGLAVGLFVWESHRRQDDLLEQNLALAATIRDVGRSIEGLAALLEQQGFIPLPPELRDSGSPSR